MFSELVTVLRTMSLKIQPITKPVALFKCEKHIIGCDLEVVIKQQFNMSFHKTLFWNITTRIK